MSSLSSTMHKRKELLTHFLLSRGLRARLSELGALSSGTRDDMDGMGWDGWMADKTKQTATPFIAGCHYSTLLSTWMGCDRLVCPRSTNKLLAHASLPQWSVSLCMVSKAECGGSVGSDSQATGVGAASQVAIAPRYMAKVIREPILKETWTLSLRPPS